MSGTMMCVRIAPVEASDGAPASILKPGLEWLASWPRTLSRFSRMAVHFRVAGSS
jgi:hypothetical protein